MMWRQTINRIRVCSIFSTRFLTGPSTINWNHHPVTSVMRWTWCSALPMVSVLGTLFAYDFNPSETFLEMVLPRSDLSVETCIVEEIVSSNVREFTPSTIDGCWLTLLANTPLNDGLSFFLDVCRYLKEGIENNHPSSRRRSRICSRSISSRSYLCRYTDWWYRNRNLECGSMVVTRYPGTEKDMSLANEPERRGRGISSLFSPLLPNCSVTIRGDHQRRSKTASTRSPVGTDLSRAL